MKCLARILARYVASAAGVAVLLLALNLAVVIGWVGQAGRYAKPEYRISEIAESLTKEDSGFVLSETGNKMIRERYQWAMLLADNGDVIWNENLPDELPRHYTVPEVASFTRWYLQDYPVYVWRHSDGLLVLGSAKGSAWKMGIEMPQGLAENAPFWFAAALVLNTLVAVSLALLFGFRLFRSLGPLVKGIENLAERQPISLSTGGLLGDLAARLNQTSVRLQRQEASLQKRDNARTTWIAGVSHDIRTPLSIVMGYAGQLEDNKDLQRTEREQARIIRRQSERIKTLVSDLNLASKLEYDMQPLRLASIHPAALVRGVVADFLNSGLDACYSIDLNVEDDAQRVVVTGDEELLRRAVSNLITNSIRHNLDGCAVTVALKKRAADCVIIVSDNGVGFPPQVLEALVPHQGGLLVGTTPPRRPGSPNTCPDGALDAAAASAELPSHRLGLTIVRQIIKAHGGATEFTNLTAGGCLVVLRLPIAP